MLTGLIQVLFGIFKVAKLMKFIPRAVMIGFVNSLAILVFMAQIPHVIGGNVMTYVFLAVTLSIVCFVPKFFRAIPAPLIAIILLTAATIFGGIEMKTIGDLGTITQSLPSFLIPNVPFTFGTLAIIFPFSLSLAIVGLMESILTASILDDMTGTGSERPRNLQHRHRFLRWNGRLRHDRSIRHQCPFRRTKQIIHFSCGDVLDVPDYDTRRSRCPDSDARTRRDHVCCRIQHL